MTSGKADTESVAKPARSSTDRAPARPVLTPKLRLAIALSVVVGTAMYLGAALFADAQEMARQASNISWPVWALILGASCLNYALRFWRWDSFLKKLGGRIPPLRHALIYLTGFSLTTTPGKAGEAIRSLYMTPYGVTIRDSVATLFVERLIDLISVTAMAVLAAGLLATVPAVLAIAATLVIAAVLFMRGSLPELLSNKMALLLQGGRLGSLFAHLASLFASSRHIIRSPLFLSGNIIGAIAWGAEGFGLYVLLIELGTDVSLPVALGIYGASVLIGAISFLPGGLGSTEASMVALMIAAGVPTEIAVLATIICRLATLWFAVVLGLLAMVVAARVEYVSAKEAS